MAFFIYHKNTPNINLDAARNIFSEMGFKPPVEQETPLYKIWHFDKILVEQTLYKIDRDAALFLTGTFIYKGKNLQDTIDSLFDDLLHQKFDAQKMMGHFSIVWVYKNNITIRSDAMNVQNIFFDQEQQIISSSFLGTLYANKKTLSLNQDALLENILTGSLAGSDTLIKEIARFENLSSIQKEGLEIIHHKIPVTKQQSSSLNYNGALASQVNSIDEYFEKIQPFCEEFGSDMGLTSGLDSRLLLTFVKKYVKNFQTHSHFRKNKDVELQIAERVAEISKVPHVSQPVVYPMDMHSAQMFETLNQGFLFFDGQVRMHAFWIEQYNNRQLRERVLDGLKLGMSGVGGEQYRNSEGMVWSKRNLRSFIEYKIFKNISGDSFSSKPVEDKIIDKHLEKVQLKLNLNSKKADIFTVKRYFNEIFIPARLGARNNAENKISFFLSPFVDWHLSFKAYEAIPFLGWSNQFEMDMIKQKDARIAAVTSDYGYAFDQKVPWKIHGKTLIKELTPSKIYQKRLDKIFSQKGAHYLTQLRTKHPVINDAIKTIESLQLPVRLSMLFSRPDIMPLLINMGFLINRLRKDNIIDE